MSRVNLERDEDNSVEGGGLLMTSGLSPGVPPTQEKVGYSKPIDNKTIVARVAEPLPESTR